MKYEVILDAGETANKCTIAPLTYRQDFRLMRVQRDPLGPLSAPILLHHEGKCLTEVRDSLQVDGIACVDCVWHRLDVLLRRIEGKVPVLARIPDGFVTAYPRRSSKNTDPETGLATIEALFVAAAVLGRWDPSLLAEYHFGRKFVELNAQRFVSLGVHEAADLSDFPVPKPRPRNSLQRRRDRGRFKPIPE